MSRLHRRVRGVLGATLVAALIAACGAGGDTADAPDSTGTPAAAETTLREIVIDDSGTATTEGAPPSTTDSTVPTTEPAASVTTVPPAPSGTLRYAEGGGVVSFNPAAVNNAQTSYLFPVYDTLTRQDETLAVVPGLATGWTRPDPHTWEFTVRDDVTFHDGTHFDASVAVANIDYHRTFPGNPQAATWGAVVETRVIDPTTFQVEFGEPSPQFPLQMSAAPGMMVSPHALDGTDLTRNPQGSGPWIWSESESEAGVQEVYTLNPDYWNPSDQGVERIEMTAYLDNAARLNALITGDADISTFTPDAQVGTGLDAGMQLATVPNFFSYVLIADRGGEVFPPLADVRVRQAIAMSIDRDTYNDIVHAGRAGTAGGIYPANFPQFHVPELDDVPSYDPDGARALLADAGYPDGFELTMPVMPAIQQPVELVAQMLGAIGITVNLEPLNNGELGGRLVAGEVAITWLRVLQVHPATDLRNTIQGTGNPFRLPDLDEAMAAVADERHDDAARMLLESGTVIPLAHANNNAMYSPTTSGVTMAVGMQAPSPLGVSVDG